MRAGGYFLTVAGPESLAEGPFKREEAQGSGSQGRAPKAGWACLAAAAAAIQSSRTSLPSKTGGTAPNRGVHRAWKTAQPWAGLAFL